MLVTELVICCWEYPRFCIVLNRFDARLMELLEGENSYAALCVL